MTTSEQEKAIMLEIMHARLRERDLERGRERERETHQGFLSKVGGLKRLSGLLVRGSEARNK
jgi:hypothetical protein